MGESKSAKLVLVFIVAILAFGISSVVAFSTGGILSLDFLNSTYENNNSSNGSNPFSFEMNTDSSNSSSSNNYYTSKSTNTSSTNSSDSTNNQDTNNNNKNNKNNNNQNTDDADSTSSSSKTNST